MELSVNDLNDSLPFRMDDLFAVYIVNSLGGESTNQNYHNYFIHHIILLINVCMHILLQLR